MCEHKTLINNLLIEGVYILFLSACIAIVCYLYASYMYVFCLCYVSSVNY